MKELILLKRGYLLGDPCIIPSRFSVYFAAQLLNKFGVLVDHPELVTEHHVKIVSEFYGVDIPASFYKNPQDTKYFTCSELLIEQVVSYWLNYGVESEESQRIALFEKVLPDYEEGKEVTFRNYQVIDSNKAKEVLAEITANLCAYTRKWNETESNEFIWLYENRYFYENLDIKGKDNAIEMFNLYGSPSFAKSLDQKDIVKLSIEMVGEKSKFRYTPEQRHRLAIAVRECKRVPLTKRQAKYFNTIAKKVGYKINETNIKSPHRLAGQLMAVGDVVGAAKVFARNGSLLERNLVWLLSRASLKEAQKVVDLIQVKNPIVAIQFLSSLLDVSNGPRTFRFYKSRQLAVHNETEKEAKYRKSVLSQGMKKLLEETIMRKIDEYYMNLPSIGKVYIDEYFKSVSLPLNTSASSGEGLSIAPIGTRFPIIGDYIRTFCYWHDARDVDTSIIFVHKSGRLDAFNWQNHSMKPFGHSALASGDDTSINGSEYKDFRISELKANDYTHAIYTLQGYACWLDDGEIFCGYQNKDDLDTKAWQPNNIALKMRVKSHAKAYMGFAIDFLTNEIIILNTVLAHGSRIVNVNDMDSISQYLDGRIVSIFNVAKIAGLRGEVVDTPEEADVVFSNEYVTSVTEGKEVIEQKIYRSSDIEKIVALLK